MVLALLGLCWPLGLIFAMAVPACVAEAPQSVRRLQEVFVMLTYIPMLVWAVYGVAVVVPYWDGKYSAMDTCTQPVRTVRPRVLPIRLPGSRQLPRMPQGVCPHVHRVMPLPRLAVLWCP